MPRDPGSTGFCVLAKPPEEAVMWATESHACRPTTWRDEINSDRAQPFDRARVPIRHVSGITI